MEWFYQIPGVGDLRSADAFFQFFAVPYQPEHNPRAHWLLARRLLAESYQQQFEENTP